MKIYMSEKDMPKNKDFKCKGCEFIEHISATQKVCKLTGTHGHGNNGDCPLKSLEQHDNEVRREFAEKVKASVCENAYTVYYDKFSSDNGMTKDGFNELINDLLKQCEVE